MTFDTSFAHVVGMIILAGTQNPTLRGIKLGIRTKS
jgi:hypothetical protein